MWFRVTNFVTCAWLEEVQRGEVIIDDFGGGERGGSGRGVKRMCPAASAAVSVAVLHISLLEPHKRYQNVFTILQKRPEGWEELIYTEEA